MEIVRNNTFNRAEFEWMDGFCTEGHNLYGETNLRVELLPLIRNAYVWNGRLFIEHFLSCYMITTRKYELAIAFC